jgi:hypothetical protein
VSRASAFIRLFEEETSLDRLLGETPEFPKNDFHFNLAAVLDHAHDFNIITQKVDDFATMKHATDPWMYINARLNKDDYIENARVKVIDGVIVVKNKTIEAGFDREGLLTHIYLNKEKVKADNQARLEDIFIKGCSRQVYLLLQSTFK